MDKAAHPVRPVSVLGVYLHLHSGFLRRGLRTRLDAVCSTLGFLGSALKAGKEDFKSTGVLLGAYGGPRIPAVLFLSRGF